MAKPAKLCEHVFVNGNCCGAPALRDSEFCYWHHAPRARRAHAAQPQEQNGRRRFHLPVVEDADSIMVSLHEVIQAILDGRLTRLDAGPILYALQTSASLLPHLSRRASSSCRHVISIPADGEDPALPFADDNDYEPEDSESEDSESEVLHPQALLLVAPKIPPQRENAPAEEAATSLPSAPPV